MFAARPAPDRTYAAQLIHRFTDNFNLSSVTSASETVGGTDYNIRPDYWQIVQPANTFVQEGLLSAGRLEISVIGDPYNAAEIRGLNDPRLNFFAQPVQIKLTGVVFDLASGLEPYRHQLVLSVNSARENHWDTDSCVKARIGENEKFFLSCKESAPEENPDNDTLLVDGSTGEAGDLSGTFSAAPDYVILTLDKTSYHYELGNSGGDRVVFAGQHGLSPANWGRGYHLCIEGWYGDGVAETSAVSFGIGQIDVDCLTAFDAFQNGSVANSGHLFRHYTTDTTSTDTAPTESDGLLLTADGTGATREVFVISRKAHIYSPFQAQQTWSGELTYSGTAASGKQVFKLGICSEAKTPTAAQDCIEVHIADSGAWAIYEKANAAGTDPSTRTAVATGTIGATPSTFSFQSNEDNYNLTINGTSRSSGAHAFRDSSDSSVTNPAYRFGTASAFNSNADASYVFCAERDENTANTAVIKLKNFRLTRDTDEIYAPTVFGTVGDGINITAPFAPRAQSLLRDGMVDVTKAPFYADPTGVLDSTNALNHAIRFAIDHNLRVHIPSGTYKVSDTVGGEFGYQKRRERAASSALETAQWNGPIQIYGSYTGSRPVIRLAANSVGYSNTTNTQRKPVVEFWAQKYSAEWQSGENDFMASAFVNVDIHVEAGNPGAIGLRMQGAQGCFIKDVCVTLTSGFTCFEGITGSGGLVVNCHAMGGTLGFDADDSLKPKYVTGSRNAGGSQPCPVLVGCVMEGQTSYAVHYQGPGSLVMVGCEIVVPASTLTKNPVWVPYVSYNTAYSKGTVNAIDTKVKFEAYDAANVAFNMGGSIALKNCYFQNAGLTGSGGGIVNFNASAVKGASSATAPTELTGGSGWIRVNEFVEGINRASTTDGGFGTFRYIHSVFIDGVRGFTAISDVTTSGITEPAATLRTNHLPVLPHFEQAGTINARRDYGVVGDGVTDDTAALQAAIDAAEAADVPLFIPKGYFRLLDKLDVTDCKIIGAGVGLTNIIARSEETGIFDSDATPTPLIQTADSATADPVIADLTLHAPYDIVGVYALRQRAGLATVCNVGFEDRDQYGYGSAVGKPSYARRAIKLVHYSGNGGGWLGPFSQGDHYAQKADSRHFYAEGLTNPLSIYYFNPEHMKSDAQTEFNNCANWTIYGFKGEGPYCGLWASNGCDDFSVYGFAGNWTAVPAAEWVKADWGDAGGDEHDYNGGTNPAPTDLDYTLSPTLVRVDGDCTNYRFTTMQPSGTKGAGYANNYVRGFDPSAWYILWDDAKTTSPTDYVDALDRPVIYKRGSPS